MWRWQWGVEAVLQVIYDVELTDDINEDLIVWLEKWCGNHVKHELRSAQYGLTCYSEEDCGQNGETVTKMLYLFLW